MLNNAIRSRITKRTYNCTCQKYCRASSVGKVVSKTVYYKHASQRELERGLTLEDTHNLEGRIRRKRQRVTSTTNGLVQTTVPSEEINEDTDPPNTTTVTETTVDEDSFKLPGDSVMKECSNGVDLFVDFGAVVDIDGHEKQDDEESGAVEENGEGNGSSGGAGDDNSGDDEDENSDRYGEDDYIRPQPEKYNKIVESNVDGIHEMIKFMNTYDFEEEKRQWSEDEWLQFLNPPQEAPELSDPVLRLSIRFYLILSHASEETYAHIRGAYNQAHPDTPLLSYDQVRRRLQAITGVFPLRIDKCTNNCLAFYGIYAHLASCPTCEEKRFDNNNKLRSQYTTIPIGPQLQALWRHPDSASALSSRLQRTVETMNAEGTSYSDIIHGTDYLDLVKNGTIDENSMVLMYSEDSAQLYRDKESSTLFGIAISGDLAPDIRHLENSVMPLFVVGGPKAAQHDSFVLPTLAHLAACQRRGIHVWDSNLDKASIKYPFLLFALADTVAMAHMSKSVGHHGRNGCRLLCDTSGRHKPGAGTYYPALLRPNGKLPSASAHDDIHVDSVTTPTVESYRQRLSFVEQSRTLAEYKKRRKETGIRGPSLFSALPKSLPCPKLFPADLMHLTYNLGQLMMQLFRGTIDYHGPDDPAMWGFTILYHPEDFTAFGSAVERAGPFIPTDVEERAPRNPAEKINSGYKASEYQTLVFGLCVGFFYGRMPSYLYEHFCQLVSALHTVHQRHKTYQDLLGAQKNFKEFVVLFEHYYYQRKLDRLHFVRPCIHALLHLFQESLRVGSLTELSQWTMERTIGNYERRIRLQADPYGNLNREIIEQAMTNAIFAMDPSFRPPPKSKDSFAIDIGCGYVSLHPRGTHLMDVPVTAAFRDFCAANNWTFEQHGTPQVNRFARLRLPNGQIVRSRWQEEKREAGKVRRARNAKISLAGDICYAEVLYYFTVMKEDTQFTLAAVIMFSDPNSEILERSLKALKVCTVGDKIEIIDAKWIVELVGMIPFQRSDVPWDDEGDTDEYFVLEKLYSNSVLSTDDDDEV